MTLKQNKARSKKKTTADAVVFHYRRHFPAASEAMPPRPRITRQKAASEAMPPPPPQSAAGLPSLAPHGVGRG
mgnify:CR=1 FL=1